MAVTGNFAAVEQALAPFFGSNVKVLGASRAAGGDISEAYQLSLADGQHVFMKANRGKGKSFFAAEAAGLDAIAQTGAVSTPEVFCCGEDGEGNSFLLMGYIQSRAPGNHYWETFAQQLAAMHKAPAERFVGGGQPLQQAFANGSPAAMERPLPASLRAKGKYGFWQDNFIGASSQINTAYGSWAEFFRDCRLKPQFRWASHYLGGMGKKVDRLLERAAEVLPEPEYPSLLHGDLWSGNVVTGNDGKAWLIDPAVSVGHREADLAMTELFGGFPQRFYDAYREAAPLQPGYGERRDFYNLYHLLNHLNLFGSSYLPSVQRIIGKYI